MLYERPKYSVLIPTRNGGKYLQAAVQSVLNQNYGSYELIVSVNHSTDGTLGYLESIRNPKLKSIQPPKPCSMTANFEYGLGAMIGEWLIILGDDDCALPGLFTRIDKLLDNPKLKKFHAISFRRAVYFWPGCETMWGTIALSYYESNKIEVKKSLPTLVSGIFGLKYYYDLPELYTNKVIHSEVIQNAKKLSSGIFYHGIAPDSYSGVAISLLIKDFLYVDKPAFLTGTSPKSNGLNNLSMNAQEEQKAWEGINRNFYQQSISDGFDGTKGVSLELWDLADDGPLFILYALEKIPFYLKTSNLNRIFLRIIQYVVYARLSMKLVSPLSEKQKLIHLILNDCKFA
jgi:glycosyltransferase involved in cell wall biosynthesis